jgi:hypothetical protein
MILLEATRSRKIDVAPLWPNAIGAWRAGATSAGDRTRLVSRPLALRAHVGALFGAGSVRSQERDGLESRFVHLNRCLEMRNLTTLGEQRRG